MMEAFLNRQRQNHSVLCSAFLVMYACFGSIRSMSIVILQATYKEEPRYIILAISVKGIVEIESKVYLHHSPMPLVHMWRPWCLEVGV